MGRFGAGRDRPVHDAAYVVFSVQGAAVALGWDAIADRVLLEHPDKLVVVAPSKSMARAFWGDLVSEVPVLPGRVLALTDAAQWRGSRSDYPRAFLVCLRQDDEMVFRTDTVRYRRFIRSLGSEPIL